jgi:hypothetical protein
MEHARSEWKEMDAFHAVLAETWHPAEKGDFAPIRAKAAALNAAARAWAAATPPTQCATPGVKQSIAAIAAASSALTARVKTDAPDKDLRELLKGIHDRFETVEKSCKAADR